MSDTKTEAANTETTELTALGALKRRIQAGSHLLVSGKLSDEKMTAGIAKLEVLHNQYLNGVTKFSEHVSALERSALIQRWIERLAVGWERPESPAVVERFSQLLAEYEVLCDAQLGLAMVVTLMNAQMRRARTTRSMNRGATYIEADRAARQQKTAVRR